MHWGRPVLHWLVLGMAVAAAFGCCGTWLAISVVLLTATLDQKID